MSIRTTLVGSVALLAASSQIVSAGGLARPNPISARGVGMGGAFIAVADDPTALHFNPAGIALLPKSTVLVGGEFVVAPRTYTPKSEFCDDNPDFASCQAQSPSAPVRPLPVLGYVARMHNEGVPSRVSFGIGLWNTYGGQLEYERFRDADGEHLGNIPAVNSTRNAVIEIVPGVAYEINDVLAIGATFRLGVGLFDVNTTANPSDSELSAIGLGAGATLGVMVRPTPSLNIGAVYRTSLTNKVTGDGTILAGSTLLPVEVEVDQQWPQSAGIGVAWWATGTLRLMAQLDWTNWARNNDLRVTFPGQENLNQTFILDWNDSMAVHAGAELTATDAIAVRAGYTYDTNAVPDHTIERQFLDSDKHLFAIGGSYAFAGAWRIDTAFEVGPGGARTVPDNCAELCGWSNGINVSPSNQANPTPGDHEGKLYSLELAVQYQF